MVEFLLALRFFLALLLYAFLGAVLYTLWRELRQGAEHAECAPPVATLEVETGADFGQQISLHPVTAVGRAEGNDLVLNDPFASAHHALFLWREGQWWIEDLESHNGTFLNGEQLTNPRALISGDHIRIGETILRFNTTQQPVAQSPVIP